MTSPLPSNLRRCEDRISNLEGAYSPTALPTPRALGADKRDAIHRGIPARTAAATPQKPAPREEGAVLMLALVFLVAVSLVILSLVQLAGNNLVATVQFNNALTTKSWANSVADVALQNVRYNFVKNTINPVNQSSPVPCWGSSATASLANSSNGSTLTMDAWCATQWNPFSSATRVTTLAVCLDGVSAAACANRPLLEVVAAFNDYPNQFGPANCLPGTTQSATSTCGTGMTIESWIFNLTLPTVSAVSASLNVTTCGTGNLLTITGTGLANATSATIYVNQSPYPVLSANSVTPSGSLTLTACAPKEPSGTPAFVAVTTPVGTSTYGSANPSSAFAYQ